MYWALHITVFLVILPTNFCFPEGSYSFKYDTDTGGFHEQTGSKSGTSGKYGFSGPDGSLNVEFSRTGGNGNGGSGNGNGGGSGKYDDGGGNGNGGGKIGGGDAGNGKGIYTLMLKPDGTYAYSYELDDQGKSESRVASGEVAGKFHFTGKDGQNRAVDYTAGIGGFQAAGDHLPKPDAGGDDPSTNNGGYIGGSVSNGQTSSGFNGLGVKSRSNGDSGILMLQLGAGGDYSYNYKLKDQAKSESGIGGKVKGEFSFTDPAGTNRAIQYTADEGGFQPKGDHIPVDGQAGGLGIGGAAAIANGGSGYLGPTNNGNGGGTNGGNDDVGTLNLQLGSGGAYSYDYSLKTQSKSESRGADGKVTGKFDFVDPDGQTKAIQYTADEGGFQPKGDHIPTEDPTYALSRGGGGGSSNGGSSSFGAGDFSYSFSAGGNGGGLGENGGGNGYIGDVAAEGDGNGNGGGGGGGSYSFDYKTDNFGHNEMKKGKGLAEGGFSVDTKGLKQSVQYSAGGNQGFQPTVEATLNVGGNGKRNGNGGSQSITSGSGFGGGGSASADGGNGASGSSNNGKQSYSFSYTADAHGRSEMREGGGLAEGSFNVDTDANKQSVTYTAGGKQGYQPTVSVNANVGVKNGGNDGSSQSNGYLGDANGSPSGSANSGNGGSLSSSSNDGSYSFSYKALAHGRNEEGQGGKISGGYAVQSSGGQQESSYTASKDGFNPMHKININFDDVGAKSSAAY